MNCSAIKFGRTNVVPDVYLLYVTPAPTTAHAWLKDDLRARQLRVQPSTAPNVTIDGRYETDQQGDYFAIAGHNLLPGASYRFQLFTGEHNSTPLVESPWISVGSPEAVGLWRSGVDQYGTQSARLPDTLFYQFDQIYTFRKWIVTIAHTLDTSTPVANTTRRQGIDGVLSLEASTTVISNTAFDSWATASDGEVGGYMQKSGTNFFWDPREGPTMSYTFTADRSGVHDLWLRIKTLSTSNSLYTLFDGHNVGKIYPVNNTWHWAKARTCCLVADTDHEIKFSARDYEFKLDKLVLQPTGLASPAGSGPDQTGFGTTTASEAVTIRQILVGEMMDLSKSFARSARFQYMSPFEQATSLSGYSVLSRAPRQVRAMGLPFDNLSEADYIKLVDFERSLAGGSFIVSAYPDAPGWQEKAHTMLARFDDSLSYEDAGPGLHRSQATLLEV